MKKTYLLLIILAMFDYQALAQQYLCHVRLSDPKRDGYGVEMFYIVNSLSDLADKTSKIKDISEASVLGLFTVPIVEPRSSDGACISIDTLSIKLTDIFEKQNVPKVLSIKKQSLNVVFEFISAEFAYCVFPLDRRYWASYAEFNKQAATVISSPLILKISNDDLKHISRIGKIISSK